MAPFKVHPDNISFETFLGDPDINIEAVFSAWEGLYPYLVDAVTTQRSELFDFASSNECMMLAAIQLKVTKLVSSDEGGGDGTGSREQAPEAQSTRNTAASAPATTPTTEPSEVHTVTTIETVGVLYLRKTEMLTEYNIGLAIHPEWRGQGVAEPVLAKATAYAFENLWAHRVQALIMDSPWSDAARTVFTSLGFTFEGTRRRAIMSPTVAGGYRNVTVMAMLDTEWHVRACGEHGPRSVWDEMFVRHHKEQEDLIQWEERRRKLRRTGSMETVREGPVELAFTSGAPSPTASSVDLSDHIPIPPGLSLPQSRPRPDPQGSSGIY